MSGWKSAGITYVQYANICARALRNALKDEARTQQVLARNTNGLKFQKWENGVSKEQQFVRKAEAAQ
ncbi:hypothetical protein DM01DRAFT_1376831 [Hesseltinella vesiculosa]|uniref:Mitochondrial ATP synthase epsilon chain domain-containing protein n=1 Tax=Hesseltinella vesiculosa TaxID=101127 RepID=A0A1X2G945_9FUNG|nr:hypothetical protein DM01DRAFT_1376831 [Hesseltinella vesiculosa]